MTKSKRRSASLSQLEALVFFIDECLGKALGEALREAGYDVRTWHEEGLGGIPDIQWLPQVCQRRWVVLTADAAVKRNVDELRAIMTERGRVFVLSGAVRRGREKIALVVKHMPRVANPARSRRAPFVARILAGGVDVIKQPKKF